jgi:adenosylcobyric acid synthase
VLGRRILDPQHLESDEDVTTGLGLLDVETVFESPKVVRRVNGVSAAEGAAIDGYQIHFGRVRNSAHAALLELDVEGQRILEGARDDVRRIWASTVHGLFDEPAMCTALLRWLGAQPETEPGIRLSQRAWLDQELEAIAEHVRRHIDFERVLGWVR